jgi:hypothetical protein
MQSDQEEEIIRINFKLERNADPLLYDELKQFKKGSKRTTQLRSLAHDGVIAKWGWTRGASGTRRPDVVRAVPDPAANSGESADGTLSQAANEMFGPSLDG